MLNAAGWSHTKIQYFSFILSYSGWFLPSQIIINTIEQWDEIKWKANFDGEWHKSTNQWMCMDLSIFDVNYCNWYRIFHLIPIHFSFIILSFHFLSFFLFVTGFRWFSNWCGYETISLSMLLLYITANTHTKCTKQKKIDLMDTKHQAYLLWPEHLSIYGYIWRRGKCQFRKRNRQ